MPQYTSSRSHPRSVTPFRVDPRYRPTSVCTPHHNHQPARGVQSDYPNVSVDPEHTHSLKLQPGPDPVSHYWRAGTVRRRKISCTSRMEHLLLPRWRASSAAGGRAVTKHENKEKRITWNKNMMSKNTLTKPIANFTGYPRMPPQSPAFQQSRTSCCVKACAQQTRAQHPANERQHQTTHYQKNELSHPPPGIRGEGGLSGAGRGGGRQHYTTNSLRARRHERRSSYRRLTRRKRFNLKYELLTLRMKYNLTYEV